FVDLARSEEIEHVRSVRCPGRWYQRRKVAVTLLKRIFGRGTAAGPDRETIEGWVREGFQRHVERRSDEAQELFRKVLEHEPRHADALFFLGSAAAQDGRELEAIDFFERAI